MTNRLLYSYKCRSHSHVLWTLIWAFGHDRCMIDEMSSTSIAIILVLLNAFYDTGANHGHSSNFQVSIPSINSRNRVRLQVEELKCNHLNRILIFIRRVNDSVCGLWRKHIYNLLVHIFLWIWSLQLPAAPLRYFSKNYMSEKLEPLLAKSFEPFNNPFCRCFLRPAYYLYQLMNNPEFQKCI